MVYLGTLRRRSKPLNEAYRDSSDRDLSLNDWVLLLSLTSIWLVCLVLHTNMVLGDGEYSPAFVPAFDRTLDGTPTVASFVADREHTGDALRVDDQLIKLDNISLSGISPLKFQMRLADSFAQTGSAMFLVRRDGQELTVDLNASTAKISWSHLPPVIGYSAIALIVLLRAPNKRGSRLFFITFMSLAIFQTGFESGSGMQVVVGRLFFIFMGSVSFFLALFWLTTFPRPPKEEDPKPRVPMWVCFIVPVLFPLPRLNYYVNGPLSPENYVLQTFMIDILFTLLVIGILGWNYLCVDPANRRKIRWVLIGVYFSFVPIALVQLTGMLFELGTWFLWLQNISNLFYTAVPISLFMAIRHFNLFDVDRVISNSVWYTALIVSFALIAEALFEPVAGELAYYFGADPNTGQLVFVGLLAMLAIPIQTFVRPKLEHLFFPKRKNMRDSIDLLIDEVATTNTEDLEKIALLIGTRLSDVLELEDCAIYLYEQDNWAPVFRMGTHVTLNLEKEQASQVLDLFNRRLMPVRLKQGTKQESNYAKMFKGIDAELIVPFRTANEGCGFLCLGKKRSLDVFTNTDVSILAGMAVQVSLHY